MPGFSEITLQDPQHPCFILREMDILRERGQFCDCTLVVQAQEFPVHKVVLATSSEYFRALFTSNMRERQSSRIFLGGMLATAFKAVLVFIYTGRISLNTLSITDIYTAADMLQLDSLKGICQDYLLNQVCTSNCIGIWKYSKTFSSTSKLSEITWWYIAAHFTEVRGSREFLEMPSADADRLISCCDQRKADGSNTGEFSLSQVVVGGYNAGMERTCERYCETTDSWQVTNWDLSDCKHFHWVGVIGLRLYAIGGSRLTEINTIMSRLTDRAARHLQTVAFSRDWECELTLPHDCSNMKFCVLDDCIYGCGGITESEFGIWRYCPSNGSWEKVADFFSDPKVFFQFFSHESRLHILGGLLTLDESASRCFESFDPQSNTWDVSVDMTVPRYNFGVGIVDQCLFAVGGVGSNEVLLDSVEMYCFHSHKWIIVNSLPSPKASMVCSGWRGDLYCFGGEMVTSNNSVSQTKEALKFSRLDEKWITLSSLQQPRLHPCFISL